MNIDEEHVSNLSRSTSTSSKRIFMVEHFFVCMTNISQTSFIILATMQMLRFGWSVTKSVKNSVEIVQIDRHTLRTGVTMVIWFISKYKRIVWFTLNIGPMERNKSHSSYRLFSAWPHTNTTGYWRRRRWRQSAIERLLFRSNALHCFWRQNTRLTC